jgi:hypothetical protein
MQAISDRLEIFDVAHGPVHLLAPRHGKIDGRRQRDDDEPSAENGLTEVQWHSIITFYKCLGFVEYGHTALGVSLELLAAPEP